MGIPSPRRLVEKVRAARDRHAARHRPTGFELALVRPVPLRCWVRHRASLVNRAIRPWLREVPHDVAPERSPFRDDD